MLPIATSADQILSANDLGEKTVPVPEWGCSVVVRELDVLETVAISESTTDEKGRTDIAQNWVKTFLAGVVKPQFTPDTAQKLLKKNGNAFYRVVKAIQGGPKKKD